MNTIYIHINWCYSRNIVHLR